MFVFFMLCYLYLYWLLVFIFIFGIFFGIGGMFIKFIVVEFVIVVGIIIVVMYFINVIDIFKVIENGFLFC